MLFFFLLLSIFILFFFFFQAEDGIRDPLVTGVQTCALPICPVVEKPEGACVGKGQDGFPAPPVDDAPPLARDLLDGGIPADGLEAPFALGPDTPERRQHPRRGVETLGVVVDLAADHTLGERVRSVSGDLGDTSAV